MTTFVGIAVLPAPRTKLKVALLCMFWGEAFYLFASLEPPIKQDDTLSNLSDETSTLFNCPSIPHNLVGPVPVVLSAPHFPEIENMHQNLTMGGHGQPVHCRARHKVAIIVPYREREEHLRIFLRNIHGFLSKQQLDYTIFVVEQVPWERTFNRGKLMNIGFVEVLKMGYWPCFIFHDVDLLPENDHNLYVCANQPKHMAVAIDKYQYKLYHTTYFGGITALTLEQMVKMNGFSNEYWGWGGEDNDMYKRVHLAGYAIHRDSTEIARYKMIKHDHDEGNPINKCRYQLLRQTKRRWRIDGLSDMAYSLVSTTRNRLFTSITVELHEEQSRERLRRLGFARFC
ncbi:hypothetical protein QR680_014468 [Steinernema hermaphroditum]|uniref:Beta-1,4-N-acetylgalactosaminyltransferase n=1 Tax=Steinernema hermaphroditum TaxID=289476 RepID=A0AA39IB61_9BILA|nr:hypothetical protein QR680_014468 [Steinernema hermaphroditum]